MREFYFEFVFRRRVGLAMRAGALGNPDRSAGFATARILQ